MAGTASTSRRAALAGLRTAAVFVARGLGTLLLMRRAEEASEGWRGGLVGGAVHRLRANLTAGAAWRRTSG